MKVVWLPEAERNLENQLDFVSRHNARAAIALGDAIERSVRQLANHPRSARPGRVRGTRELVVPGTPFLIVYFLEEDAVVILRILHGAQRWPPEDAD